MSHSSPFSGVHPTNKAAMRFDSDPSSTFDIFQGLMSANESELDTEACGSRQNDKLSCVGAKGEYSAVPHTHDDTCNTTPEVHITTEHIIARQVSHLVAFRLRSTAKNETKRLPKTDVSPPKDPRGMRSFLYVKTRRFVLL